MTAKPPYTRVLLPLDLSDKSARITEYSELLQALGAREALLLHVLDESLLYHVIAGYDPHKLYEEHSREALKKLAEVAASLEKEGLATRILPVAKGHVASVIAETAKREGTHLIAMTDRGAGFFKLKLLGSTVEEVANTCAAPLLVVKTSFHERHVTRLLVPVSLKDPRLDESIVEHAAELARLNSARITLLHVVEEGDSRKAEKRLKTLSALIPGGAETIVAWGRPYKVIVEQARERHVDLLVIGNDECMGNDPGEHGLFEGAVSDLVLKRSPVHVLVVPKQ